MNYIMMKACFWKSNLFVTKLIQLDLIEIELFNYNILQIDRLVRQIVCWELFDLNDQDYGCLSAFSFLRCLSFVLTKFSFYKIWKKQTCQVVEW